MRDDAVTAWENLKTSVSSKALELKTDAIAKLNELWDYIQSIPSRARQWGRDIINGLINGIRSVHIPMPHFDFSVSYKTVAGVAFPVPDVDVNWYKTGGVFTKPVLAGFGDVQEAIVPFEGPHARRIASLIAEQMNPSAGDVNYNFTFTGPITVRDENDIRQVSRELWNLSQNASRASGRRF